jgi:uncharacterized caspase-like protein
MIAPSFLPLRISRSCGVLALAALIGSGAALAQSGALPTTSTDVTSPAPSAFAHALVIGIDDYKTLPKLRGAVADATDIADTARRLGGTDVVLLTNADAERSAILRAAEDMRARAKRGDLVLLALAGHGALEPERVRGSSPDGQSAVFLLSGFAPSGPATAQRILDEEFMRIIRGFEDKGARVLFVADSCSGGGLARGVDARSGDVIYRAAPKYVLSNDELNPISTVQDAMATELSFKRSMFLAAVERDQKSPEVRPPGESAWRGALSYALARGVEGAADANGDGSISVAELFGYVREVSYQLTDQRQEVVTRAAPMGDPTKETVAVVTRGVSILNPKAPAGTPPPSSPTPTTPSDAPASTQPQTAPVTAGDPALGPRIRLASLDGQQQRLAALSPIEAGLEIVAPNQQPDVVWDPITKDVIAAGDVIARNLDAADLPAVADRMAAVRGIKKLSTQSPLTARLSPDAKAHKRGQRVKLSIDDVAGKALYLFNIAGDGTVQVLYPVGSDPQPYDRPTFQMDFSVREPFGSDQIVAVSAAQKLGDLDQALKRLDGRRSAAQALKAVLRTIQPGARVGSVALVTGP